MPSEAPEALGPPRRGGSQRVPRPPGSRIGGPPPWDAVPLAQRGAITLQRVRDGFARRGWAGTSPLSSPPPRRSRRFDAAMRPAAVLCPLFEEDGETRVVLTRRSAGLRSHTGEVSFPGGRLEDGEPAVEAALREAWEEVGLDPSAIEIIGSLSPLVTVTGQVLITPFVGALAHRPQLTPNPAEVELAFDVPLAELVTDGVYREELWELAGEGTRPISFFELIGDTVWGATGWMLRDLLDVILEP